MDKHGLSIGKSESGETQGLGVPSVFSQRPLEFNVFAGWRCRWGPLLPEDTCTWLGSCYWVGGGGLCTCSAQSCLCAGRCLPVGHIRRGCTPALETPVLQKALIRPPTVPPGVVFRDVCLIHRHIHFIATEVCWARESGNQAQDFNRPHVFTDLSLFWCLGSSLLVCLPPSHHFQVLDI